MMLDNNPSVVSHEIINNQQAHHFQQTQQEHHAICIPKCDGTTHAATSSFKCVFPYVVTFLVTLITFLCSIVAAVVVLPLLLACFFVTRFLQIIFALGHNYDKSVALKVIIKLKLVLRTWIYIDSAYMVCLLLVLYGVAQFVPPLGLFKYTGFLGRSITYWIETFFIVFGICTMSYIVSIFMIRFVIFNIPPKYHTFQSSCHVVSDTVHEAIDCFILYMLTVEEVVIRTPTLKQYKILGFYPIHWLLRLLILLLVFHNLIRLSIHIIVWQLHKLVTDPKNHPNSFRHLIATKFWGRKSVVYWANGTKPSIMFTLTSLMLLLTWVCYVVPELDSDHTPTSDNKKVLNFGIWTCLCIFIFSFLWLIKTYILLLLEIRTIYNRFGPQISKGGKQLYFLGIIGRHSFDIFKIRYKAKKTVSSQSSKFIPKAFKFGITKQDIIDLFTTKRGVSLIMLSLFPVLLIKDEARYRDPIKDPDDKNSEKSKPGKNDEYYVKKLKNTKVWKLSLQRKNQVREDLLTQERNRCMIYELQKMVHYFLEAKQSLSQDNYTSTILQYLQDQADDIDNGSIKETLKRLTDGEIERKKDSEPQQSSEASNEIKHDDDDDHDLHSFLNIQNSEDLKIWMERARNRCVFLANTLSSAKELVECLDRFMSLLIIVVAFILWLLLTKLATTKVFVVIGSPIIAFSFIFGDATKTFFQGIVFVYLVHPFDVGDLCVIDGKMMEVITIGVWKTTFSKVDTREEVIYPNSDLVNKNIINHKTEFDWNDFVELYVDSTDKTKIVDLMQKIEKSLKDDKYESIRGGVEVMTSADNKITLGINFRYHKILQKKNMNYYECFWEKRRLRSEFIQNLVTVDEKEKKGPNNQVDEDVNYAPISLKVY